MRPLSILRTFVAGVLAFAGVVVATYHLAMWLSPPRTSSGHPTMALGHVMIAILVGGLAAIVAMIVDRWLQHRARDAWLAQYLPEATANEAPRSSAP